MSTTRMSGVCNAVMITWEPYRGTWLVTYHEMCASSHNGGLTTDELLRDLTRRLREREAHVGPEFTGPPPWGTRRGIG